MGEQEERRHLQSLLDEANGFCVDLDSHFPKLAATATSAQAALAGGSIESEEKPRARKVSAGEGSASAALFSGEATKAKWQEDTASCQICRADFEMVKNLIKKRRHHCRICGLCVCSQCAPNSVMLKGFSEMQRVCTPCVGN